MGTRVDRTGHFGLGLVALALSYEVGVAHATPTSNGGVFYDQECFDAGVPMPPDFFPPTGTSLWTYNGVLTDQQSFTGAQRYIYFFESSGKTNTPDSPIDGTDSVNPQGICSANVGTTLSATVGLIVSEINVLCQGANGKTCFWRWPGTPPISFPLPSGAAPLPPGGTPGGPLEGFHGQGSLGPVTARISSRNGNDFQQAGALFGPGDTGPSPCNQTTGAGCLRAFAGGNEHGFNDGIVAGDSSLRPLACSACHAGDNMIINHPNTATDFRTAIINACSYFPTLSPGGDANWPDPIVPIYTPGSASCSGRPCDYFPPFNPGPSNYPTYVNAVCFNCHVAPSLMNFKTNADGGRFPLISAALGPGDVMYSTAEPTTPDYANTVFFPSVSRPLVSGCTPSNCNGAMPLTEAPTHSALGDGETFAEQVMHDDSQWLTDVQAPTYNGSQTGAGYQWPQIGVTTAQYLSPYGIWLNFTEGPSAGPTYTALEATSTHFCWVTGLVLPRVGMQPNDSPSMFLTRFNDPNDNNTEHWQLQGFDRTPSTPFGRINAQCAPWGAFFASPVDADIDDAVIPSYNVRQWNPHKAMTSYSEKSFGETTTPEPVPGSSGNSACFISGFDGDFVATNNDRTPAGAVLWWPGETSPNNYQLDTAHDGRWFVQLINTSAAQFAKVHVTCIDVGLVDPGLPHDSVDAFNALQTSLEVSVYEGSPSLGMRVTAPVFGSACFFTQIVAQELLNNSACGGNVATSEVDNGPGLIPYNSAYQYNAGNYFGPSSINGHYVIGESLPGTGDTCNTAVTSLAQNCISVIQ